MARGEKGVKMSTDHRAAAAVQFYRDNGASETVARAIVRRHTAAEGRGTKRDHEGGDDMPDAKRGRLTRMRWEQPSDVFPKGIVDAATNLIVEHVFTATDPVAMLQEEMTLLEQVTGASDAIYENLAQVLVHYATNVALPAALHHLYFPNGIEISDAVAARNRDGAGITVDEYLDYRRMVGEVDGTLARYVELSRDTTTVTSPPPAAAGGDRPAIRATKLADPGRPSLFYDLVTAHGAKAVVWSRYKEVSTIAADRNMVENMLHLSPETAYLQANAYPADPVYPAALLQLCSLVHSGDTLRGVTDREQVDNVMGLIHRIDNLRSQHEELVTDIASSMLTVNIRLQKEAMDPYVQTLAGTVADADIDSLHGRLVIQNPPPVTGWMVGYKAEYERVAKVVDANFVAQHTPSMPTVSYWHPAMDEATVDELMDTYTMHIKMLYANVKYHYGNLEILSDHPEPFCSVPNLEKVFGDVELYLVDRSADTVGAYYPPKLAEVTGEVSIQANEDVDEVHDLDPAVRVLARVGELTVEFDHEVDLTPLDGLVECAGDVTFRHCYRLTRLPAWPNLVRTGNIAIHDMRSLVRDATWDALRKAGNIMYSLTPMLSVIKVLSGRLESAAGVDFRGCARVTGIRVNPALAAMDSLAFVDCPWLQYVRFDQGSRLRQIDFVDIRNCGAFKGMIGWMVTQMGNLSVNSCAAVTDLASLSSIRSMQWCQLIDLPLVEDLEFLAGVLSPMELYMVGVPKVDPNDVPGFLRDDTGEHTNDVVTFAYHNGQWEHVQTQRPAILMRKFDDL
jgi:hypothetical protein